MRGWRLRLYEEQGGKCGLCGGEMIIVVETGGKLPDNAATTHRFSKVGNRCRHNCKIVCCKCNITRNKTPKSKQVMFEQQGGLCYYCERPMRVVKTEPGERMPDDAATREHKVPKKKGGRSNGNNIVLACYRCNTRKGHMSEKEFRQYRLAAQNGGSPGEAVRDPAVDDGLSSSQQPVCLKEESCQNPARPFNTS
jgi:5-methylcytosine-specific restriction endonuclease McrA